VTDVCETGDDIEIDFRTGRFINHTRNIERSFPPIPPMLQELIELGGNTGWLKRWWATRNDAGAAVGDKVPSS
jgi:3-isopropylmalate/(R)-2-methylmalate dehydratase small subunit